MHALLLSMIESSGASQLDNLSREEQYILSSPSADEKPIKAITTLKVTPALAKQCNLIIPAEYLERGKVIVRTHWNYDTRERLKSQLYHVVEDEYPIFLFDLD